MKNQFLHKYRPAADKKILILIAGLMWWGIGLMLMNYSVKWLSASGIKNCLIFGSAGLITAIPVHYLGFLRLAEKNLARLMPLSEKRCLFSFMPWKSYLIVPVMISLGLILRNSAIPSEYLSVVYTGIGLALFMSGTRYMQFFILSFRKEQKGTSLNS